MSVVAAANGMATGNWQLANELNVAIWLCVLLLCSNLVVVVVRFLMELSSFGDTHHWPLAIAHIHWLAIGRQC